jgi:hypothetical protein
MNRMLAAIAALALALPACAQQSGAPPQTAAQPAQPLNTDGVYSQEIDTFSEGETAEAIADFFGVNAEAAASTVERIFSDQGRPTAYIAGQEAGGAIGIGLRYGEGYLTMKTGPTRQVYWQGPSIGFDIGGDASRVFVLVYDLHNPDFIYRRFPGVEGSAYLIAGMSVVYKHIEGVTLAEIRSGAGARLGVNAGYINISRNKRIVPF